MTEKWEKLFHFLRLHRTLKRQFTEGAGAAVDTDPGEIKRIHRWLKEWDEDETCI